MSQSSVKRRKLDIASNPPHLSAVAARKALELKKAGRESVAKSTSNTPNSRPSPDSEPSSKLLEPAAAKKVLRTKKSRQKTQETEKGIQSVPEISKSLALKHDFSDQTPASTASARKLVKRKKGSFEAASPKVGDAGSKTKEESKNSNGFVVNEEPSLDDLESESFHDEISPSADDAELSFSEDSQEPLPEAPKAVNFVLSTFKPSRNTIKEYGKGSVSVRLEPGERLVVLGQFGIAVQKGQVTIMGMTLKASTSDRKEHRISAPSSHALPVIRCPADELGEAIVKISQSDDGLESLRDLSPLFGKLWNSQEGLLGLEHGSVLKNQTLANSSYQIVFSSQDGPSRTFLQPLVSPPEWNEMLAKCSVQDELKRRAVMVCGPKGAGKSTFTKLLINRLLSNSQEASSRTKKQPPNGIILLDLDPGQPEYSTPGQLSLIRVREPNFGPPFSHPTAAAENEIIRSHSIGSVSPAADPGHYMECATDLYQKYQSLQQLNPTLPLVINTPGWVLGTGLEMLVEMIQKFQPTEVIYMSKGGPPEVVESLKEARNSSPLFTLPSQSGSATSRTAAHLRTMQYMSYFHLDPSSGKELKWNATCLSSIRPWEIKYAGDAPGILGVLCYGEQPPAELLAETINGSLVVVVVIENIAAIPGCKLSDLPDSSLAKEDMRAEDEHNSTTSFSFQPLQRPLIISTPSENIPYFNPVNAITLNPKHSYCIGLALVRGINTTRQRLQILTPISSSEIQEINDSHKSIVLVSGKLDTPGWAYTEASIKADSSKKVTRNGPLDLNADIITFDDDGDEDMLDLQSEEVLDTSNQPWVERHTGGVDRGPGAKVWRVRRDLGKSGDD